MKLRERLKENRELGRAEGLAEGRSEGIFTERVRLIRKLHLDGRDLAFISDLLDENKDWIEIVIGMIESDSDMDDTAIAEKVLRAPVPTAQD